MINKLKFEKISLDEGLSQCSVYCILQDRTGFMWFGTQDGLNRYDGYSIIVYKNNFSDKKSIANNYIKTIFEDKEGTIWVGTLNGTLAKFDVKNESFTNYNVNNQNNFSGINLITCICEYMNDNLLIGTDGGGLIKFDKEREEFININWLKEFKCDISNRINCILPGSEDLIWIGTADNGLYLFDKCSNIFCNYKNNPSVPSSLNSNLVYDIYEDSKKNILVATAKGLNIFEKNEKIFKHYLYDHRNPTGISDRSASCICEDKNNVIWIGTKNVGLKKFNMDNEKFESYKFDVNDTDSISDDVINSLYCDSSNSLWIGTFGGGVNKIDCTTNKFHTIKKQYNGNEMELINNIHSLFVDSSDTLWIGTFSKGLYRISDEKNLFKRYGIDNKKHSIAGTSIMCMCEDSNSNLWIGTWWGGLNLYNPVSDDFSFFKYDDSSPEFVHTICKDVSEKYIWIGTFNKGLLKFDVLNKEYVPFSRNPAVKDLLSKNIIKSLLSEDKFLWIGTHNKGILKYDLNNDIVNEYTYNPKQQHEDFVNVIFKDCGGILWIGCNQSGLNKFECVSGKIKNYTSEVGLKDNIVKAIFEDENSNLWICTNSGVSKFNPDTEEFTNYDVTDGLQGREFNDGAYFQSKDGTVYFGGINGFSYFNPKEIKDNPYIPNIVITDFRIFNKSITPSPDNPFLKSSIIFTNDLILSYRESVISFEFAALIYNNQTKNQYAYKMEGFDDEWIFCGSRRNATYTNLDHGNYTFRVKGSNNDGLWNEEGTSVKILITPPYWKTWWFKGLGFIGMISATALTYRKRLEKIKKEKIQQEEYTKKIIESQEEDRRRVAAELHDSLGQELLVIKNKALISIKKSTDVEKFKEQMNEISELTSSTINVVREISYDLRPYELDRLGLTKTILSLIERATKSTNINFVQEIENIDNIFAKDIEINIYRILQECFSNIMKHSEATKVLVGVKKLQNEIVINVCDNGKGFNAGTRPEGSGKKGFGLKGIPERVKLFGGIFDINSLLGDGTDIKITLPFNS